MSALAGALALGAALVTTPAMANSAANADISAPLRAQGSGSLGQVGGQASGDEQFHQLFASLQTGDKIAGFAAAGAGGAQGAGAGSSTSTAASAGRLTAASAGSNQPAAPQMPPATASSSLSGSPTIEGHADQIRGSFSDVLGPSSSDAQAESETSEAAVPAQATSVVSGGSSSSSPRTSAPARRGPTVHRYNIGTWGAYHAARIAAQGLASVSRRATEKE